MGRLSSEQKKFYKENGYLILKNIISEEMLKEMSTEYDNLFERANDKNVEISWIGKRFGDRDNNTDKTVS